MTQIVIILKTGLDQKNYQRTLFPYAYNILGSVEDAKDAIQDVLTKFQSIEKGKIENEDGFLIKSTVNHSINLKNRRSKMLTGNVWLPEPVSTDNSTLAIDAQTILSYSMLVLLERLTAKERAVFILKEAFDYSHKEIAGIFDLSIENSRKSLSRAKGKLTDHRVEMKADNSHATSHLERYIEVMQNADVAGLEDLLSDDILLAADGGENIKVVKDLTTGIAASSKLLIYVYKAFLNGLQFKIGNVNHQPAIFFYQNGSTYNCQVFEMNEGKILSIYSIVDPAKLGTLS